MIRVRLLGRFAARSEKRDLKLRDGSKAQELLAYLLLNAPRPRTREAIAGVLWAECPTSTSRAYLRKALWQLRSAFEQCDKEAAPLLELDAEWVRIRCGPEMWSDVTVLDRAYRNSCHIEAHALEDGTVAMMRDALELYGDGLMPNRYEGWCVEERERYREMYLAIGQQLLEYYISRKQYSDAVEQGRQILRCDKCHERTYQRLMWLYSQRRDRASALSQYQSCVLALEEGLGIKPSQETIELYVKIRDGAIRNTSLAEVFAVGTTRPVMDALREFRAHLRELESRLSDLTTDHESLVSAERRAHRPAPARNASGYAHATAREQHSDSVLPLRNDRQAEVK